MTRLPAAVIVIILMSSIIIISPANSIEAQSHFVRLNTDIVVNTTLHVTVLQKTITVTNPNTSVLVVADGRYNPIDAPAGSMRIAINGSEAYTTYAINDWGSAKKSASAQHSFNVMAHAVLQPGSHTIALRAGAHPSRPGRFVVGSFSGMSILLNPGRQAVVSSLNGESGVINVTTYAPPSIDIIEGSPNRPLITILKNNIFNSSGATEPIISMISGRAFNACTGFGDALWGISQDGWCQWTDTASWSVNDLDPGAETQAPMYAHGYHALGSGETTEISFKASELAFGSDQANSDSGSHENKVCYKVGNAKLVSVVGSAISGGAGGGNAFCSTYKWKCVATTTGWPGCPAVNNDVPIATDNIYIPSNHNGVVFFSAKTRIQAANEDGFLTVRVGLKIDGQQVGTLGIQQLPTSFGLASRTLTAPYLSTQGPNSTSLTPGWHTVQAFVNVEGNPVLHASVPEELTLVYFD